MNILWLSRHGMTPAQQADLFSLVGNDADVITINMTFLNDGKSAAQQVCDAAQTNHCYVITGVMPAHVAVHLVRRIDELNEGKWGAQRLSYFCPVSVASPAVEGEVRGGGFTHDHWELLR